MASFSQQQQQRAISPHRTMVWTEPKSNKSSGGRKVPVVYYLCREDGQPEHPHFMEVLISCDKNRLCLRDFTERLDMLRGKGMAAMYSWSSKRSYRNQGFVWHDLTEEDIIHPANREYILKGSQRLASSSSFCFSRQDTAMAGRRNWSRSFDLADQSTQHVFLRDATDESHTEEVTTGVISPPPPSSSCPDEYTLQETLITTGGRMRASSVLMQLISCGTTTTVNKSHSQKSQHKEKNDINNGIADAASPASGAHHGDFFSGSLAVETNNNNRKKKTADAESLKRSSSCNADMSRRRSKGRPPGL